MDKVNKTKQDKYNKQTNKQTKQTTVGKGYHHKVFHVVYISSEMPTSLLHPGTKYQQKNVL
jgi:hypothetical protein